MKKILSVFLLICLCLSFAACGGDTTEQTDSDVTGSQSEVASSESSTDTSTDTSSDASDESSVSTDTDTNTSTSTEPDENTEPVANLILAGDQYHQQVVVYDLDALKPGDKLDFAEEWTYNAGVSHIAGLKYREDTVFGDVIVLAAGANNGKAQLVSYPEGKLLWSTDKAGNNPHCIEILPSGNIVVASSTGGTLRLFKTSALLEGDTATAATYEEFGLYGAHGVLWDPKYEILWGLGDDALMAFNVTGEGVDETLTRNTKMSSNLPADGGHALAPDLTDPDFLYVSVNSAVYRFAKKGNVYIPSFKGSNVVSKQSVKGVLNNANGDFVLAVPNGTFKSWCTDTLTFCYLDGNAYKEQSYKSADGRAFYKICAFYGKYQ